MARKKLSKTAVKKKNIVKQINRKISEYEKLGFDDAKIYNDFILALTRQKGIKLVRRSNGTYYISQSNITATVPKLEKLATFKSVASQIKKYGGKEKYREQIDTENFITEYINEIGYDIGVELFDEFGSDLKNGLKNKYTRQELINTVNKLKKESVKLPLVNPFG